MNGTDGMTERDISKMYDRHFGPLRPKSRSQLDADAKALTEMIREGDETVSRSNTIALLNLIRNFLHHLEVER